MLAHAKLSWWFRIGWQVPSGNLRAGIPDPPKTARVTSVLSLESISKAKFHEPKHSIGQEIKWVQGRVMVVVQIPCSSAYTVPSSQQAGGRGGSLSHPCDLRLGEEWGQRSMSSWMCQELRIEEKGKNREAVILMEDLPCANCIHIVVFINLFILLEKGFIFCPRAQGNRAKKTSQSSIKVIFTHHSSILLSFLES